MHSILSKTGAILIAVLTFPAVSPALEAKAPFKSCRKPAYVADGFDVSR
ncbi:MAG: hypothetical protein ACI4TJ_05610 [Candidatus Cryptobacteroides sp.]